ncbi:hypothetical protein [Mesorhizobium sp. ANAO-SY3R2]
MMEVAVGYTKRAKKENAMASDAHSDVCRAVALLGGKPYSAACA